jgi:hypothetical protein
MPQHEKNKLIALQWRKAWTNRSFKIKTIVGSISLTIILVSFPRFFAIIELRKGIYLEDVLLNNIPSIDFSIPIFIIIWSTALLLINRMLKSPGLFLQFLISFLLLCITRIITISLFPLEAPIGLVAIKDPISNIFYGGKEVFITKDLFYSGHTATQFLMFLSFSKKGDKIITGISSVLIVVLVLFQHVHYTIDVIAAIPFGYLVYILGKKIASN